MAEYIEREALLAEAKRISGPMTGDGWDNWGVYALINRQPAADVVEVVRCKDCIHRPSRIPGASDDHEGLNLEFPDDWCPMQCVDGWYNRMPRDDFFCGYGERDEKING